MSDQRERFVVTFEALPHPDKVPAINRLRMLLKTALRSLRLKCVSAVEAKPEQQSVRDATARQP